MDALYSISLYCCFLLLIHYFSLSMGGGGPSRVQDELESLLFFSLVPFSLSFYGGGRGSLKSFKVNWKVCFFFFSLFYGGREGVPQEFKVNWKVCFVNDFCDGLRLFDISFCNLHASSQTVIIY